MLVIFTVILLGLLVLGLPVAFSLGTAGLFGMFAFMGGGSSLAQIPILAYKSLDDFVLTAVPLYILQAKLATIYLSWAINGCVICLGG